VLFAEVDLMLFQLRQTRSGTEDVSKFFQQATNVRIMCFRQRDIF
jgi:hypothetical protein